MEYKDLLGALDPRYLVPGQVSLNKEIVRVFIELKVKLSPKLLGANMVSLCCDIWSKKGLASSYFPEEMITITVLSLVLLSCRIITTVGQNRLALLGDNTIKMLISYLGL